MISSLYNPTLSMLPVMNPPLFSESKFKIIKVRYPDHMDEIGTLRISSWKNERGVNNEFFSQSSWIDDLDSDSHHWIVVQDQTVVASARMSFHYSYKDIPYTNPVYEDLFDQYGGLPIASINRLVVDPGSRGQGLARLLDEERIAFAIACGAKMITAQPLEGRVEALKRLNFDMIEKIESPFQIPGRSIYFMIRKIVERTYVDK
jgi:GNAT superfamily N-acetyltransferase